MKDRSSELRRVGGTQRYSARVRRGYRDHLQELWSENGGAVRLPGRKGKAPPVRRALQDRNWLIKREGSEYLAIEPGREYETPFATFDEALDFAAAKIKEGA